MHLSEITEDEILQIVMESHSSPDKKKAFIEAKRKILVSWSKNDIWRPISRSKYPKGTIIIPAEVQGKSTSCKSYFAGL